MNIQDYMNEIVVPTILDFKSNPRSRRHAYLSAIVTFHIKDYLIKAGETGVENTMRTATGEGFDIVRGICNGTKHVYTDKSHLIPFVGGDDWDRPPAVLGEMVIGVSRIGDTTGGREVKGNQPSGKDIYVTVVDVIKGFCNCYPTHLNMKNLSDL